MNSNWPVAHDTLLFMCRILFPALFSALSTPVTACDLALALAVDISGSVDPTEYDIQMQGLAEGLRDGAVAEALVSSKAQIALVQWTGASRQEWSIDWTRIESFADTEALATRIASTPRAWRNFSTAIGEALAFTMNGFSKVPDCRRRVIDVSGDGMSNEGQDPRGLHAALGEAGITVNALVIEGQDLDLTAYYWENVITGDGAFVVTANGFAEYPARMRLKLLRETTKPLSLGPGVGEAIPAKFE